MFARAFSSSPVCRKCFASDAYARAIVRKSSATFRRCDRAGTAIVAFPSAWSVREMSRSTRDCNSTGWVFDESAENPFPFPGEEFGRPSIEPINEAGSRGNLGLQAKRVGGQEF